MENDRLFGRIFQPHEPSALGAGSQSPRPPYQHRFKLSSSHGSPGQLEPHVLRMKCELCPCPDQLLPRHGQPIFPESVKRRRKLTRFQIHTTRLRRD